MDVSQSQFRLYSDLFFLPSAASLLPIVIYTTGVMFC
jgi:hypothetical protein